MTEPVTHRVMTSDGVEIALDYYQTFSSPAVIVICPGFFQHRRTPRFRQIASCVADRGYDVVVFDFRGHGQSGGLYTFGQQETQDLRTVLDFVRPRYPKLGVLAFSLGASIAIHTLADTHQSDGLIAVAPVANLDTITPLSVWWPGAFRSWWSQRTVRRSFRGLTLHYGKPHALDVVDQVSPTPILFIHGTKDWLVNVQQSQCLYTKAREPKQLHLIPGGRHAEELFERDPDGFLAVCCRWFQEVFEAKNPRSS